MTQPWIFAISLLLLLPSCSEAKRVRAAAVTKPNIIVVMTDDQRWDMLTAEFMPQTWDRFVSNGIRFTNAFTTTGLCCPSRMSFLTGDLASRHGVQTNDGTSSIGPDEQTLAVDLQAQGYRTMLIGKYVNNYGVFAPYIPPGWTRWAGFATNAAYLNYDLIVDGNTVHYGETPADYSTDVIKDIALDFINQSVALKQPFFAFITPTAPHPTANLEHMVAQRHQGMWSNLPPYRERAWAEADMSDKSAEMQSIPLAPGVIDSTDGFRILQLESLLAVDELMNAIYQKLVQKRIRKDTIVVFTSDNGFFWYEHRLTAKNNAYDEGHRVPLVVSHPNKLGLQTQIESRLIILQDITTTLAAWAGVTPATGQDGYNLTTVLQGQAPVWPRTLIPFEGWYESGMPHYTATRQMNHKVINWATGEIEEYDLIADPFEKESLQ